MSSSSDVAVIIPTYFRNDTLLDAIASVLEQTTPPAEVLVIDDSGERHAADTCAEFVDVTYLPLDENQGPQRAREIGLSNSTSQYVQFFDDDDRLREDAIEKRRDVMDAENDIGVVYSAIQWDHGGIDRPRPNDVEDSLASALAFDIAACTTSNMLIDRRYLEPIRPITGRYTGAGDLALAIWLAEQCLFAYVDEPLLLARATDSSLGVSIQAIESRSAIIEDFDEQYARYPDHVKRRAIADTWSLEGRRHLAEHPWSARAIHAFARAVYAEPGGSPYRWAELVSSFGGRPTRELAVRMRHAFSST